MAASRDDAKAVALYMAAGEREHAASLQALALAYAHGELGLEPDEEAARRYSMEAEHVLREPPMPDDQRFRPDPRCVFSTFSVERLPAGRRMILSPRPPLLLRCHQRRRGVRVWL